MLLTGAAVLVAVYALTAAWIVATGGDDLDPLELERSADGAGVVVSGSVADASDRDALIEAIGVATNATTIISDLEIDPDAEPIDAPDDIVAALIAGLPPELD